jgi:hypothetical protein
MLLASAACSVFEHDDEDEAVPEAPAQALLPQILGSAFESQAVSV